MDWKLETEPALQEIRRMLKEAGLSQAALERRLGYSKGYISQLFGQNLDLKVSHVLAILDALECPPGDFFARAYPGKKKRRSALDEFQHNSDPLAEEIDYLLAQLYKKSRIESLNDLQERLVRCEEGIARLERQRNRGG
jgi:transcriptional regulator with XRE-family HTH domain